MALIITGFISLTGCITRSEGCLDIAAQNFDLDAERNCERCCKYPPLSLTLSQRWDTLNFTPADTLTDINGIKYRILDLKYVLSAFSWKDNEEIIYTIDSSTINCGAQSIQYTQDIIVIDSRRFSYPIDSIKVFPAIQSVHMKLGWLPVLSCVDETNDSLPVIFSDSGPLWDSVSSIRAAMRLVLQRDITIENFDTLYIDLCEEIDVNYPYEFILGKPVAFKISVDYKKLFMNVDITDPGSFRTSIITNVDESFFITP